MKLESINPSDNTVLGEVAVTTDQELKSVVEKAQETKEYWKDLGISGRNNFLTKFYDTLEKHAEELAFLESQEMGMPIKEAEEDVSGSIKYLRWYSEHAAEYLSPEVTFEDDHEKHVVYREPRGVVAVIIPWNFPMSNFVWQCGQNLVAGNVVVLKNSEEVPLFSKKLEQISLEAGMPNGVLGFVYGDGKIGDLLAHQNVDMICFTGSTKVGQYLYKVAAEKFIPAVLEMGGSAPGIIFSDADIPNIVDTIILNRFLNCGQICDGLKRLIVHNSKLDETIKLLKEKLEQKHLGVATDTSTDLGPLVAERQVLTIETQVSDAVSKGATVILGGKRPEGMTGAFYLPTLLTNITKDMKVWQEEVFGPILPIVSFETEEEAINLANDTMYGLGGYIFTQDKALMARVADKLNTGMVSQNNLGYCKECNPFGGYKKSGMGREHGKYGFHDVTQIKVVAVEK